MTASTVENVFPIATADVSYRLYLPDHATDHIQGFLASSRRPYEGALLVDGRERLSPGDLLVDVGANVGNHTLFWAVTGSTVVAYEPDPHLCEAIRESVLLNDVAERVEVRQFAVSDRAGTSTLVKPDETNLGMQRLDDGPGSSGSAVQLVRLDHESFPARVAGIKIDVEGHELEVLRGAAELLQRDRPFIYVECLDASHFAVVSEHLVELGYVYLDTFNVSPTHLFVFTDANGGGLLRLMSHFYDCSVTTRSLRQRLDGANVKYREATEAIDTLKSRLRVATETATLARGELATVAGSSTATAVGRLGETLRLLSDAQEEVVRQAERETRWRREVQLRDRTVDEARSAVDDLSAQLDAARAERDELADHCAEREARAVELDAARREALADRDRQANDARRVGLVLEQVRKDHARELARAGERAALAEAALADARSSNARQAGLTADLEAQVARLGAELDDARGRIAGAHQAEALARAAVEQERGRYARTAEDFAYLREWVREAQERELELERALLDLRHVVRAAEVPVPGASAAIGEDPYEPAARRMRDELERVRAHAQQAQREAAAHRAKLTELRASKTYRAGQALAEARSLAGLWRLLGRLREISRSPAISKDPIIDEKTDA